MMGTMRTAFFAASAALASAFAAVPAWAVRDPGSIKSPQGYSGIGVAAAIILVLLIMGISLMSPRRTHQD